jgi:Ca2+-transporting ATPase
VLLSRCTEELEGDKQRLLDDARRSEILRNNEDLASQALRTLGIAYRVLPAGSVDLNNVREDLEHNLVFAGLIGMIDPPRDEARGAVERARNAGIRPMMITGDHPRTAAVIAADLGISADGRTVTGSELEHQDAAALEETTRTVSIYARVNPEHKLKIVKALQKQGGVIAMTGDGVNDAPALKTADIGVAMGITGTDVSKEAADMVLADDNFATIVAAVEEGRAIFSNIRKFLRYLLSSNIGEVMTMFFGVMLGSVLGLQTEEDSFLLPLAAAQLLWINLITDGAPALALGLDPADPDLMTRPPRPAGEGVLTRPMWIGIFFVGVVMAGGTLLVLDACLPGGFIAGTGTIVYARTMAFTTLMMFQLFNVFNARSDKLSAFRGMFSNSWLWGGIALSLVLHAAVLYVPFLQKAFSTMALSSTDWFWCALVASSVLWLREVQKVLWSGPGN